MTPVHEVLKPYHRETLHEEEESLHHEEAQQNQMPVERFEPRQEDVKHHIRHAPIVNIQLNIEPPKQASASENPSRRETLSPRDKTLSLSNASIAELKQDEDFGGLHEEHLIYKQELRSSAIEAAS